MPTVPKDNRRFPSAVAQPSETDLMMALATMKELGRIPTFDERFRGQDLSSLPMDVRSKGGPVFGQGKNKAEPIPSDEKSVMIQPDWAKRESIGVSGGSR
jgi:hypothetical protein